MWQPLREKLPNAMLRWQSWPTRVLQVFRLAARSCAVSRFFLAQPLQVCYINAASDIFRIAINPLPITFPAAAHAARNQREMAASRVNGALMRCNGQAADLQIPRKRQGVYG